MTGDDVQQAQNDLMNRMLGALDAGGVDAVVAALRSIDDPTVAGRAFDDLGRNLYRARKDVTKDNRIQCRRQLLAGMGR